MLRMAHALDRVNKVNIILTVLKIIIIIILSRMVGVASGCANSILELLYSYIAFAYQSLLAIGISRWRERSKQS